MPKRILLICRTREKGFSKYENLRFKDAAEALDCQLEIIPFPELSLELANSFDIVLPRTGSGKGTNEDVLKFLSRINGPQIINGAKASRIAQDKYECLMYCEKIGISIPKTVTVDKAGDLGAYPIVIKERLGARGDAVYLVKDEDQLKDLKSRGSSLIAQEYIDSSRGRDLRVVVVKDKVVGAIERRSITEDFRANFSLGGQARPFKIPSDLTETAIKICQCLRLDYCGCDFLFGKNKFYLCEVNIHPDFQGFDKATKLNLAKEILSAFV